jgi:hypothetical protein
MIQCTSGRYFVMQRSDQHDVFISGTLQGAGPGQL